MESLYLLIPIALLFAALIAALLIWAVNKGQYDDLDKDAWRALNDDLAAPHQHTRTKNAPKPQVDSTGADTQQESKS